MKDLLYKEFHLAIHPLFYLILLCGALMLIPQWIFFIALMYFFFIVFPNIFSMGKSNNDVEFSVMLPVRKRDVVKARIISITVFEILQILAAAICAVLNRVLYHTENYLLDLNFAFFGFALIMYALFNIVFFPMFYKTAYKIGGPAVLANIAAVLFAAGVEFAVIYIPALRVLDGMDHIGAQLWVLAAGVALFAVLNIVAYRVSAKRFERVDL